MEKEFVPYEQVLKLKQLGFDGLCFGYWNIDPCFKTPFLNVAKPFNHEWCLPAPTFSQAFRWFREKKLSDACICRYQRIDDGGGVYYYYVINHDFGIEETKHFKGGFNTYEEAELDCLNKSIEIVESKSEQK